MPLADYRTLVADLVQDRDEVASQDAVDRAIAAAVRRYEHHFQRRESVDETAAAGYFQALPAGWQGSTSELVEIEFPIDQAPKAEITARLRQRPTELVIELEDALAAGDTYRVVYTVPHVVDAVDDSVPAAHRYAVACLAASIVCGLLSAHYATEGAPTIGADVVDHQGKSGRFRSRQRDLEAEFAKALGISDKPAAQGAPAGVVVKGDRPQPGRLFRRGKR